MRAGRVARSKGKTMASEEQPTTPRVASEDGLVQRGFVYDVATQTVAGVSVVGVTLGAKQLVGKLKQPTKKR